MAKYNVTFSCGHTERKELFGSKRERRAKIAYWEQHGKCTACYEKEKEGRKAAIKKVAEEIGLPVEILKKIFTAVDAEQYLRQAEEHAGVLKANPDKTGKYENAYIAVVNLGKTAQKYGL